MLEKMTIVKIKELAEQEGYTLAKTLKVDIIKEFLEQQEGIV